MFYKIIVKRTLNFKNSTDGRNDKEQRARLECFDDKNDS